MGRKIFILTLVSLLYCMVAESQWKFEKSGTVENLNAVFFVSGSSGWIAGDNGTILYKSGSGWIESNKPTDENLNGIYMLDENNGWAVGARGTILRFDGRSWQSFISPTSKDLHSVFFRDPENGVAVGELGTVLMYDNGKWNITEGNIRGNLHSAFFSGNDIWFGGGLECVNVPIMKMTLEDASLLKYESTPFATINAFFFLSPYNGWAVGSPSTLLHYNGVEWTETVLNDRFPSLVSVSFLNENDGICAGYSGTILTYKEGKWIRERSFVQHDLKSSFAIDETYYVVGDNGTILKKSQSAVKSVLQVADRVSDDFILYPNPSNEIANIVVESDNEYLNGSVLITDKGGMLIFQEEFKFDDGQFSLPVVTKYFPDGIYFCKVNLNGKMTVRKFVVIH